MDSPNRSPLSEFLEKFEKEEPQLYEYIGKTALFDIVCREIVIDKFKRWRYPSVAEFNKEKDSTVQ